MAIVTALHKPSGANAPADDDWFTVDAITERIPVSRDAVYDAIKSRALRAATVTAGRRRYLVKWSWVTSWLEAATTPHEITR